MGQVTGVAAVLPWATWVLFVAFGLSILGARRLAVHTRSPEWVSVLLVASLGLVAAAALAPQVQGASARLLNVALFVPLGMAIGLVARRSMRLWLVLAAVPLPLVIELVQSAADSLHQGAQLRDVIDSTVGVLLGLALGVAVRRLGLRRTARG